MKQTPGPDAMVWKCGILPHLPSTAETAMTVHEIADAAKMIYGEDYWPIHKGLATIGSMPQLGTLHKIYPPGVRPGHHAQRSKWWFESKREIR